MNLNRVEAVVDSHSFMTAVKSYVTWRADGPQRYGKSNKRCILNPSGKKSSILFCFADHGLYIEGYGKQGENL